MIMAGTLSTMGGVLFIGGRDRVNPNICRVRPLSLAPTVPGLMTHVRHALNSSI